MAKKQSNNSQWDGEFQSKPKHNPKQGKQSSSGKPSGKPATQHPQNKPALPKMGTSSQPSAQPAPTPASPRGGKPNSRYKPQPRALPVEMYVAAAGNPLAQSLLMALQHEGKPKHVSNEKYLHRFAHYGWHRGDDELARRMVQAWNNQQLQSENINPAFLDAANLAIEAYKLDQEQILADMRAGILTPAEARSSLEHLRLQKMGITNALNNLDEGGTAEEYEALLEAVFGYDVFRENEFTEQQQIEQMTALAVSNLAILQYIERLVPGQGIDAFNHFFSENGRVNIHLGAEKTTRLDDQEGFSGLTPLIEGNYDIFLGSQMSVGAITHEFFHQLDRAIGRDIVTSIIPAQTSLAQYLDQNFQIKTGVPLNPQYIYEVGDYSDSSQPGYSPAQILTGYVGQIEAVGSREELLADIGMTAVLSGSGQRVLVRMFDGSFEEFDVAWDATQNADAVRNYFDGLMRELFKS
ncbi:MAG: hypothetical protein JNJ61_06820 [Anaerolineae bacterium]|nr:hypothetical protein [Anaerolineae bacterium]